MQRAALIPHPFAPAAHIHGVVASVIVRADGAIGLSFDVLGDVDRLRMPPRAVPARTDGLWRHTCVEAFLMAGGGPAYHELNFSPSGAWAAYAFRGYRDGRALDADLEPAVVVRHERDRLQVDAVVPVACVPQAGSGTALRLGLAAVLEDADGSLSYWALRHPGERPDFHHADSFGLDVAGP